MKCLRLFFLLATLFLLLANSGLAQAPQRFQYQAVARSATGELLANKQVRLRLSLHQGSPAGMVLYQESHQLFTNNLGLFSLAIGDGQVLSGSLPSIDWANSAKYLRVEIDPNGGTSYIDLGTTQLLSVPYALYAESGGTTYLPGSGIQISGQTIINTGDLNPNDDVLVTSNFGGDVTGTYDNLQLKPNVVGSQEIQDQSILGSDLNPMGASAGEVLKWNGSSWAPGPDLSGSGGSYSAGTGIDIAGSTISALTENALWNAVKLYGQPISASAPSSGQVLKWNGMLWAPAADETGSGGGSYQAGAGMAINGTTISALTNDPLWNAARLQGRFIADLAPTNGQTLVWNNNQSRWEPQTLSGSGLGGNGTGNYIAKFTSTNNLGNSSLYEGFAGVAIGSTDPAGRFHIAGSANQPQFVVQAHTVQQNTQPLLLAQQADGSELFRIHSDNTRNLFIGLRAGQNNQVIPTSAGEFNTFVGSQSGEANTIGSYNSALGYESLGDNTTGSNNTVMGAYSLRLNQGGNFNTALGAFVLEINSTGNFNTALGSSSMNSNTTGAFNTAIGSSALNGNNAGNANIAVGHRSMFNNVTGSRNVAVGQDALYLGTIANYNVALGTHALYYNVNRDHLVAIGDSALYSNSFGAVDPSQARGNTAIGSKAMLENTTGSDNTAIGYQAMSNGTVGSRNVGIGYQALQFNQLGEENTAIGYQSLHQNFSGLSNTAVGLQALYTNGTGARNTALGKHALYNNTQGNDNTAMGFQALEANQGGERNVAIGYQALLSNNAANFSTAVGAQALEFSNTPGNTALGYDAGSDFVLGPNNTFVGFAAKTNLSGYTNSTALGAETIITGSNMVRIGNSSVNSIGGFVNWSNISDGRIKTQVREDIAGIAFIRRLRPVSYHLDLHAVDQLTGTAARGGDRATKESQRYSGFIAQEVEAAARESGYAFSGVDQPKNPDDLYSLRYAEFVVPLVKAVQEQQRLIEEQAELIRQLQQEMQSLRRSLAEPKSKED